TGSSAGGTGAPSYCSHRISRSLLRQVSMHGSPSRTFLPGPPSRRSFTPLPLSRSVPSPLGTVLCSSLAHTSLLVLFSRQKSVIVELLQMSLAESVRPLVFPKALQISEVSSVIGPHQLLCRAYVTSDDLFLRTARSVFSGSRLPSPCIRASAA